ncbi:MAG: DNA gyrase inhibitor YacG, partial [Bdellovibrionales bacterium]|nr:DNA gyrase inhibitor YacG [Bdellovibrionales bacterium]
MTTIVRCPQCGTSTEFSPQNQFRPFCSERCRLIDLGQWADGSYKVPVPPDEMTPQELIEFEAELNREIG